MPAHMTAGTQPMGAGWPVNWANCASAMDSAWEMNWRDVRVSAEAGRRREKGRRREMMREGALMGGMMAF